MRKQWEQEVFLAILSRILTQSCVTPPYIFRQGVTHDCASILDSVLLRGLPCFFSWCIPTSIFIDFYTCIIIIYPHSLYVLYFVMKYKILCNVTCRYGAEKSELTWTDETIGRELTREMHQMRVMRLQVSLYLCEL